MPANDQDAFEHGRTVEAGADLTRAQPKPRSRWTRTQLWILFLLVLVNISNYLDRGVIAILQQPLKQDLALADWQLGVISGPAFAILYSLAGVPSARLADRGNRITVLGLALALWSGMTALCGAAQNFLHLALARLGVGAGEGACTPVSHSLIADTFPPRQRGIALAVLTTSIPIAQLFAPLIGGVVAMTLGWRAAFVVVGLPGILLAVLLRMTVRDPGHHGASANMASGQPDTRSSMLQDLRTLFSRPAFLWLWLGGMFLGQGLGATNLFTASYFLRQYQLTLAEVGAVTAVGLGVAGLVGTFAGGYLSDRFAGTHGRSYPLICCAAATGACVLFMITFSRDTWQSAIVFLLLANIMSDLKNGPINAAVQNLAPPGMRSTASAVFMVGAIALGTGIGPLVVGVISDVAAQSHFPDSFGSFLAACPGGKAPQHANALVDNACAMSSAFGLRIGLVAGCVAYGLAAPCFLLAAFKIRTPLAEAG
jgi:predicted MFS family arabinose efflux permease